MKKVSKKREGINERRRRLMEEALAAEPAKEARLAAIQMLIPVGLSAVNEALQREWAGLVGERYARGKEIGPWGSNRGSVYLGDQKVRVKVPRARRRSTREEVPLINYIRLQQPGLIEEMALKRVLSGVSQGNYAEAALTVPETFGITRDAVSKKWIRASARKLEALTTRSLAGYDIVAMVLDGKAFGDNEIILALGVTISGEKVVLGFIEASTENFTVRRDFLGGLIERGLPTENEILVVIDGGKGLRKAVTAVLEEKAVIARCQWHKRENVVEYLNKDAREEWRRKLQNAYEEPDYEEARERLLALKRELRRLNVSAANSLEEGLEETLTPHRLGLMEKLGTSFKTTNMIENVHGLMEDLTWRVCRWHNSEQRQRWVASALLKIEPRLRRVKGHEHLPALRVAMRRLVRRKESVGLQKAA